MTRFINALNAKRASLGKDEKGFTLIELLVVVIIIGILAAIAIPIYIGVQNNAKDSAVQSDLTNIKTSVVSYYTNKSSMPTQAMLNANLSTATTPGLGEFGYTQGAGTLNVKITGDEKAFCLSATAGSDSSKFIYITSGGGATGALAATSKPTGC